MPPLYLRMVVNGINKTRLSFGMVLNGVSQQQAADQRDGPDGWSVLEIMCHVRDYQNLHLGRIDAMVTEDNPALETLDRLEMVEKGNYAGQVLQAVMEDYSQTRTRVVALLGSLDDDQWERAGHFPDGGGSTVGQTAIQMLAHEIDHLEEVMRVLRAS